MTTTTTHTLFYVLLNRMDVTKETVLGRYNATSLTDLRKSDRQKYNRMIADLKKEVKQPQDIKSAARMDKVRKQVIASITGWFKAKNIYQNLTYGERIEKAKSIAERAKGADFNKLTYAQLRRIVGEFNEKQRTANAVRNITGTMDVSFN